MIKNRLACWLVIFRRCINNIHCEYCDKSLVNNKLRRGLIGGTGGGIGAAVLMFAMYNFRNNTFGIKNIILIILWISMVLVAALRFTKLEIEEDEYYE